VAHEDDDLIFMNPDIANDIRAGKCVATIFLTAGDAGLGTSYWTEREAGPRAAYAYMAGVNNNWNNQSLGAGGKNVVMMNLLASNKLDLIYLRLPDGRPDGSGYLENNSESMRKLWSGQIANIHTLDGTNTYTSQQLIDTLAGILNAYHPDTLRSQNYSGVWDGLDHNDHFTGANFAKSGYDKYASGNKLSGYWGYQSSDMPLNVSGDVFLDKMNTFLAYADHDYPVCQTASDCMNNEVGNWLQRQYTIDNLATPTPTIIPTPTPISTTSNIAGTTTVSASSETPGYNQLASKAIDGVVDGYPGDYTKEWATTGGKAGSWLNLVFTAPVYVDSVSLFDRPNSNDQITSGNLTFSDGSIVTFGALNNNGSEYKVSFTGRTISSVRLNITGVKSTTENIGLSEIKVFGNI